MILRHGTHTTMFDRRLNRMQRQHKTVLVLVLALLLAQWLVLTHVHVQKSGSPDSLCSVCLAGEHLGHAVSNSPLLLTSPLIPQADFVVFVNVVRQTIRLAFHSRAPPFSSNHR